MRPANKSNRILSVLFLSMIVSFTSYVFPQEDIILLEVEKSTKLRKWSISTVSGLTRMGAYLAIEDAMEKSHFDIDVNPLSLFRERDPIEYPQTSGRLSVMLGAKRRLSNKFSVEIISGISHCVTTGNHGYAGKLTIHNSVVSLAPIFSINFTSYDNSWFGIGPSFNYIKTWKSPENDPGEPEEQYSKVKAGIILDLGFRIPDQSPWFIQFDIQYRYMGRIEVGPFSSGRLAAIPEFKANCSHIILGIGAGVRF